jgi:hypothetical protein
LLHATINLDNQQAVQMDRQGSMANRLPRFLAGATLQTTATPVKIDVVLPGSEAFGQPESGDVLV